VQVKAIDHDQVVVENAPHHEEIDPLPDGKNDRLQDETVRPHEGTRTGQIFQKLTHGHLVELRRDLEAAHLGVTGVVREVLKASKVEVIRTITEPDQDLHDDSLHVETTVQDHLQDGAQGLPLDQEHEAHLRSDTGNPLLMIHAYDPHRQRNAIDSPHHHEQGPLLVAATLLPEIATVDAVGIVHVRVPHHDEIPAKIPTQRKTGGEGRHLLLQGLLALRRPLILVRTLPLDALRLP